MKLIIAGTRPPDYIVKNVKKYAYWMVRLYHLAVFDGDYDDPSPGLMTGIRAAKHSNVTSSLRLKVDNIDEVDNGDAYGGDHLGVIMADSYGIKIEDFKADWRKNGKAAGMVRNRAMADYADELYLVWDGKSAGSKNMKEEMVKRGKPVHELVIEDWTLGVK